MLYVNIMTNQDIPQKKFMNTSEGVKRKEQNGELREYYFDISLFSHDDGTQKGPAMLICFQSYFGC